MRLLDTYRFDKLCTIINRIKANLVFTQSLSDFFANDGLLEPALMVISDAIRRNLNLRTTFHGGRVVANAVIYSHRASPYDREFADLRHAALLTGSSVPQMLLTFSYQSWNSSPGKMSCRYLLEFSYQ